MKLSRRKSVIFTWMLSYILVFMIPMAAFLLCMLNFVDTLRQEVSYSNSVILKHVSSEMDNLISDVESLCGEITLSPEVQRLFNAKDFSGISQYNLYAAVDFLARLSLARTSTEDFYLYLSNLDIVATNASYQRSDNYYNIYIEETGIDKDDWDSILKGRYRGEQFCTLEYEDLWGNEIRKIAIIFPLFSSNSTGAYTNLIVFVDESAFVSSQNWRTGRENILIMNTSSEILYNFSEIPVESLPAYGDLHEGQLLTSTVDGENMTISSINSSVKGWKYLSITPTRIYDGPIHMVEQTLLVSLLLCFLIGGITSNFLIRKNYSPIEKILESLEEKVRPSDMRNNEYQYINQAISDLKSEKQNIENEAERQKDLLRSSVIFRLVENRDRLYEITPDTLKQYDITFVPGIFFVLIYSVNSSAGPFLTNNENLESSDKYRITFLILKNITEELLANDGMKSYVFHTDNLIGFIVNSSSAQPDIIFQRVADCLNQVDAFVEEHFQISFRHSCSNAFSSWQELPQAYRQALEVLEYQKTLGLDQIIFYHDVEEKTESTSLYYPTEQEVRIENAICCGEGEQAYSLLQEIIDYNLKHHVNPESMRYLMMMIAGTILHSVGSLDEDIRSKIPLQTLKGIFEKESLPQNRMRLQECIDQITQAIHTVREKDAAGKTQSLYKKAKKYVDEHYMDENLSVGMIAEEFGVHIVHISRVFKEMSGDNLSNYIQQVRLKKAKELIGSGQTMEKIARAVGYNNVRTFIRAFKKSEGITPGKYKENKNQ